MIEELFESGEREVQVIVFSLGKEEYAMPIKSVQEIIMHQPCTRIPRTPEFIEGVINLRGNIIPIINGRKKFNMGLNEDIEKNDMRIMIIENQDKSVGFIVDSVTEVVHLGKESIDPPHLDDNDENNFLCGFGKYNDRLLILLDPAKFLNVIESQNIENFNTEIAKKAYAGV